MACTLLRRHYVRTCTGPRKTPSENTHITDKAIHGHKFIEYSPTKTKNTTDSKFVCGLFSILVIF